MIKGGEIKEMNKKPGPKIKSRRIKKQIKLDDRVYFYLKTASKDKNRSIPNYIEYLVLGNGRDSKINQKCFNFKTVCNKTTHQMRLCESAIIYCEKMVKKQKRENISNFIEYLILIDMEKNKNGK